MKSPNEVELRSTEILKSREAFSEKNDCVVTALALVTDIPYAEMHKICESYGRKRHRGMYSEQWMTILDDLGFEYTFLQDPRKPIDGSQFTPISLQRSKLFQKGRYLIRYNGHLAALIDGVLLDWMKTTRHRVRTVITITGKKS